MKEIGFGSAKTEKLKIRLELTEANKIDDTWELTAIGIVINNEGPVPDIEVQFFHNGKRIDSPVATDGEGRAIKEFVDLKKGIHTFETQIVGTSIKNKQTKKFKDEKPIIPKNLIVDTTGAKGKYELFIRITDENGKGISEANLEIINEDGLDAHVKKTVNKNDKGLLIHSVSFTERKRIYTVIVLGSEQKKTVYLSGPIPTKKEDSNV